MRCLAIWVTISCAAAFAPPVISREHPRLRKGLVLQGNSPSLQQPLEALEVPLRVAGEATARVLTRAALGSVGGIGALSALAVTSLQEGWIHHAIVVPFVVVLGSIAVVPIAVFAALADAVQFVMIERGVVAGVFKETWTSVVNSDANATTEAAIEEAVLRNLNSRFGRAFLTTGTERDSLGPIALALRTALAFSLPGTDEAIAEFVAALSPADPSSPGEAGDSESRVLAGLTRAAEQLVASTVDEQAFNFYAVILFFASVGEGLVALVDYKLLPG